MRLARRNPRRDQPSIGIGEIPPYSDPNSRQRRQRPLVPPSAKRVCDQASLARPSPWRWRSAPRGKCPACLWPRPEAASLLAQPCSELSSLLRRLGSCWREA